MDIRLEKVFGAGFMLATLLASFAAFSQDEGIAPEAERVAEMDALEPGFDTSSTGLSETDVARSPEPEAVLAENVPEPASYAAMDSIRSRPAQLRVPEELPKVLVIVPWQKAEPGDIVGKPVNTLLDEVLAPIDREEFVRQVNYYGDVYGEEAQ